MKYVVVIITVVLLVTVGSVLANDGLSLLRVETGARPTGMGGAFTAIAGTPDAVPYNPANAIGINTFQFSAGHMSYWDNIRMETGHFAVGLSSRMFLHGGIRFAAIDNLEYRGEQASSEPLDYFDAHDASFKAGLSYRINDWLSSGVSIGALTEKIEAWRGGVFTVDVGLLAKAMDNVHVGASVINIGSDLVLSKPSGQDSRPIPIPTTYRFGGTYQYERYLGAVDIVYVNDKAHLHLGAEAEINEVFQVRAGYMFNYDVKDFAAGLSLRKYKLIIDYAFVPYKKDLGTSHVFNLIFNL